MRRGSPYGLQPTRPHLHLLAALCAVFFMASLTSPVALHWPLILQVGDSEDNVCDGFVGATMGK